ncbi:LysR family transcriptional regulator [Klebsiella pneumoniae]|uniref:LysR family transcriptional regulator n=1 Tax=Klebsiella pneumoniae TaxID=573 RepID=UPI00290CA3EA|nr:LysR family transcriptional regulator [Klebsiella pneumoniae]MDU8932756.1 LysR family transcriptional regulator [Klebsiella pneumoniae]
MRMSVKQLRAFLAVAHTLNFAHASERLNLSQPALSLTIQGLEEALARSGRQLDVALESHQLVTVGRMVASGLGGSAVPALCKTQMASLGAVCIPLSDPPIEKCVGAIHAGHLPLSKAAQALLDTLKGFLPT